MCAKRDTSHDGKDALNNGVSGLTLGHANSPDWSIEETPSLRDQTVSVLREAILNGTFDRGEKLVERSLADKTGVSRTSIREALGQLVVEGLVTRVPGRGMHVTQLSEAEARAIYEARAILESAMSRLFVARATENDMQALDAAVEGAERTDTRTMARQHAEKLDRVFDVITQGAGNPVTRQMASLLRIRVTYLRTITSRVASAERRVESMKLLRDIREALRARDADLSESRIKNYVERSAVFALDVLKSVRDADSQKS